MEQLFLMPGEERYERFKDGNGVPKVHYSYRSMRGAFFDCESRSLEEALPHLRTDKFQYTTGDATGFIRDQEAVGKLLPPGVDIRDLKARRNRIAAAQQSAQNAGNLCCDRDFCSLRGADGGNGLTLFY